MSCKLIIPPGLEDILVLELQEKWQLLQENCCVDRGLPEFEIFKGGVRLLTTEKESLYLCYYLKTPSKILWEICSFKASDFPSLYKKMLKISWKKYLNSKNVKFLVSSKSSRLRILKKVESCALDVINKNISDKNLTGKKNQKKDLSIFVLRINKDICQLSYQLSGEEFYKKKYLKYKSKAPLRENLAACIACLLHQQDVKHLIDPMCGSSSIALAFLDYYRRNKTDFADTKLKTWKSFTCKKINQLKILNSYQLFCNDIDPKEIENSHKNLKLFNAGLDGPAQIHFSQWNATEFLKKYSPSTYTLVCNLPYEKRAYLSGESMAITEAIKKYNNLCLVSETSYKGKTYFLEKYHFLNGGFPVLLGSFKKPL